MKFVWEPEDIKTGRYFVRGNEDNYSFSCLHKIGYIHNAAFKPKYKKVGLAMTDGAAYPYGENDAEFAQALNDGGYVPITPTQAAELIIRVDASRSGKS